MRIIVFIYGIVSYAVGVASLLYLIGFVSNSVAPKTIDSAPVGAIAPAVVVDLILIGLFALQHSLMARPGFKERWTRIVPKPAERSTYVLITGLVLALLCWQWQPIPGTIWNVEGAIGKGLLHALFWLGWVILFASRRFRIGRHEHPHRFAQQCPVFARVGHVEHHQPADVTIAKEY